MKTVFDESTHNELLERFARLTPDAERQWGKMSPGQMMEHSARALEMAAGKEPRQQRLLGKAIGWIFKSGFLSEKPIPRNAPTGPTFIIQGEPEFEATRKRLTDIMAEFHGLGEGGTDGNIHGFFGPLSGKQWGETQYKHLDHHLRQFGL
ncbi:MAG TPA: DUF1569 domain-containing protein [Pyrinomonadaceae bacterium]|jgi:hypothetical protein|nr:DUF1569 domain-containing protein [Pyrinomonadaceae bacterium]